MLVAFAPALTPLQHDLTAFLEWRVLDQSLREAQGARRHAARWEGCAPCAAWLACWPAGLRACGPAYSCDQRLVPLLSNTRQGIYPRCFAPPATAFQA